jgi:hypothetical protein
MGVQGLWPLTDDEIFGIVLEKVRATFPRINTPHLNTKGRIDRTAELLQTQEPEVGLNAKRIREEVEVNFTGGFTAAKVTTESKILTAATR